MVKDNSKKNKKSPVKLYAIITEGEITEPQYFNSILRLFGANLKLTKLIVSSKRPAKISKTGNPTCAIGQGTGPNPIDIISSAKVMLSNRKTPYEKIYCVFDKDTHADHVAYEELKTICSNNKKLFNASSVPSFEYWLCLHFEYHDKPFTTKDMEDYLRKNHLPNYDKHIDFNDFQDKIQVAIDNAEKSIIRYNQTGTNNPLSYVGKALEDMHNEGII